MNPDGLVLAGSSQGAPLALEIAHETGVPWLCVIPGFPAGYDLGPLLGTPASLNGAFLVGEKDPLSARTLRIAEALRSAGAIVRTLVMPGVGHELPEDFSPYAREALISLSTA
jgi:predicted esterase